MFVYITFFVNSEGVYTLTHRREVGTRTQPPSDTKVLGVDVRTDCAPLIEVGVA